MKFLLTIPGWINKLKIGTPRFLLACFLLLAVISLPASSNAQERKRLENKRQKLSESIRLTTKLLNQTTRSKAAIMDRYVALQEQIKAREELILTLQQEVVFADSSILRNSNVIEALGRDVQLLEDEYAQMTRQAYRQKATQTQLLFLFSAKNLNQLFARWQYLRQYDQHRQRQAKLILETRETLIGKVSNLEERKLEKEALILSEAEQKVLLAEEMNAKTAILKKLKTDESRLRDELSRQRIIRERLNKAIEKVIRQQMTAARKRARTPKAINKAPKEERDTRALTGSFGRHRGRLPWPVSRGVVTRRFGQQSHPSLRKIEITNNGIDIRTDRRAKVKAVYEGKVVGSQVIPGYNRMLILKHGDYYTVYSNLEEVYVRQGQYIKTGHLLGKLALDRASNKSEIHFEVWRDKVRLNPVDWLIRQ